MYRMKTFFLSQLTARCVVALWMASGVGHVLAQTPSALVNGLAQVNRGGTLALPVVYLELSSLKPSAACGNRMSVSATQAQISWGGMSALASPNCTMIPTMMSRLRKAKGGPQTKPRPTEITSQTSNQEGVETVSQSDNQAFELLYENFHRTYRLGPGDEVAIRVRLQPDYSLERVKVSPDGRLYHPLIGDIMAGGLTVDLLTKRLTQDLARYIREPEVSVQLIEAKSAKVGVLGEVLRPGVFIMNEPMTVLDALTQAGGFARTGKSSNVTLVRQTKTGRLQSLPINVKRIIAGKADVEENLPLQPGDTVIVHGNVLKKLEYLTATLGFTQFLAFLTLTR